MQPIIESTNLRLCLASPEEAGQVVSYFKRNELHLKETMPKFPDGFFEESYWEERLKKQIDEFNQGLSLRLFIYLKSENLVIGTVNFTEIIRGVFQGCFLGYGIDKNYQGQGFMTEALKVSIDYVFEELNLHKVLANYMPRNKASGRVLSKLGFEEVGLARQELYLNSKWEDHVETRLVNHDWVNTLIE